MKIAIFHNFLDNIGGAEMVSLILARELSADVYTTNIDRDKISKMGFANINVRSIGRVPINAPFKQQLSLMRFRRLNLKNKYDFYIISGDWAMAGAVNNKPNLWYVHSPIREIWDLYEYTRNNTVPWLARPIFDGWAYYNRYLNRKYIKEAERIVCNSCNTKMRLKRFLQRNAEVINPPVDTSKYKYQMSGDFWLSVNRLIGHKRVDLQLEAFRKMPEKKLIIVGSYEKSKHFRQYAQKIVADCPANVKIMSWISQDELLSLYANCRGLVTTAHDEDFGMTAIEAMASGKPVIAPNEGGYRESIIDGVTGRLINDITVDKIVEAVKELDIKPETFQEACFNRARDFATDRFIEKIRLAISSLAT